MTLSEFVRAPCSEAHPHEAHVYQSFIAGGPPGPVPTLTCICPGVGAAASHA